MKKKFIKVFCYIYLSLFAFNNVVLAKEFDCDSFQGLKTDLQNIFNFFKILVPLLIVGLSTYDFIKAITEKDDKDIKKAFIRLMKRLIYAVILFFLPVLLNYLMNLVTDSVCIEEVMS